MKKRKLLLLSVLLLLLLLLLFACGSREIKVLDYGGTGENRYLAQQEITKNFSVITAADALDGTIYYVTKQKYSEDPFDHPTILASVDAESGEMLTWKSMKTALETFATQNERSLSNIAAISVQPDGSAVLLAELAPPYNDAPMSGGEEFYSVVIALNADGTIRWGMVPPEPFFIPFLRRSSATTAAIPM